MNDPDPHNPNSAEVAATGSSVPPPDAAAALADFLNTLRTVGGFQLDFAIHTVPAAPADESQPAAPVTEVLLSGPDTPLLLERNGELLHAIESIAAAILRLTPEQGEQLSFDAAGYKAQRAQAIAQAAADGIANVRSTERPFPFPPMNSRERRLLHLALLPSGLATASSGLGPRRFVVLYPEGQTPEPERFEPAPRRSPAPFRNNKGYKNRPGPSRADSPSRPARSPQDLSQSPHPPVPAIAAEDDEQGNRRDSNSGTTESAAATEARLESIRRAFRKR